MMKTKLWYAGEGSEGKNLIEWRSLSTWAPAAFSEEHMAVQKR